MNISDKLDQVHLRVKQNRWHRYFSIFCRIALAAGFLPSGFVKINGERFTDLSNNQPMGHYLEALFHTGYYYPFIGVMQMTAAVLLLIPRTVTLGALIYFPIILNICILSLAVRFDGSHVTAPLMVLANLYLLCWNYDKIKYIFPFNRTTLDFTLRQEKLSNKFPIAFFTGVAATFVLVVLVYLKAHDVMPRNTLAACKKQFVGSNRTKAGNTFCECIHTYGQPLDQCLAAYGKAPDD
ncbi:DoxX family protein [Persicitalea jodogahamensis]|uniref:DoxX family protein n=1 Tax=Persicitalea jodogahamensis TaxID=402147 RepID=UPI0016745C07|nr:DoxX family protein [Persicitalea jodogahamensis]